MRLQNILLLTAIMIGQLVYSNETSGELVSTVSEIEQRFVTRVSLEIGSGTTKITVATVDSKKNVITKILYQNIEWVQLRQDLAASKDGCLSPEIEKKLICTLKTMQQTVASYNPQQWVGVGTSIFRTAKNGLEFLEHVKQETGINISVISQAIEGEVGLASAAAASGESLINVTSIDIGSGSFQITSLISGKVELFGSERSFVNAMETFYTIRNQPYKPTVSDPVKEWEAAKLIELIRNDLPPIEVWINDPNKKIIGIGSEGGIFFAVREVLGRATFTKEDVLGMVLYACEKSDEEITAISKSIEPGKFLVAMSLLYAIMDHCGFNEITYAQTNGICEGVLIIPSLWK